MTREPLFYLGLLVLVLGVGCAAIPVDGIVRRLFLIGSAAFVVAGALLVSHARDVHRFRVVAVRVQADGYTGRCPADHEVQVLVDTLGGDGELALRVWGNEDFDVPVRKIEVPAGRTFELLTKVRVTDTGLSTAYANTEAPTQQAASESYEVRCTGVAAR